MRTAAKVDSRFTERIERFATTLALWGPKMNLTAHPEDPEEIAFHVIDSLMPLTLEIDLLRGRFEAGRNILDLGSGAGFPGLVLAAASSAQFTLLESRRKRANFLQAAIAEMALANVIVELARAERADLASRFDVVTGRAFGNPATFFSLATEALRPGGIAILYANPSQHSIPDIEIINYRVARGHQQINRILAVQKRD